MERSRSARLATAGDTTADELGDFDAVVRMHRPRIFRFILASLRDRETAENLTQDCLIKAYQARDSFRGASNIGTWLMQIAANLVRDHETSGRLRFWRRALQSGADLVDLGAAIPDSQQSPESLALIQEQVRAIWI